MHNLEWQYLEERSNSWRRQLYIKGKKLLASDIWSDAIVNKMTPNEVANNKGLPIEAVNEAIAYCQSHQALIEEEAIAERNYLESKGYQLEPKIAHR
ncbi:MAG: hypothetical protein QNJ38_24405 [Prochloraceae cyanobacterium]|nr:hypothetical protein [Prochloraceae cyanobacterium]